METLSKVSVIIPSMKGREELLKRLLSTIPSECETIVVDDEDLLLAAKRNKGARQANGEYLLFIDDDNWLKEGAIESLTQFFYYGVGAMGITACYSDKKMLIADGGSRRYYLAGFTWGINTNSRIYQVKLDGWYFVDEVANAFMIRREAFEEVGGFDEENFPIDLDEADICKRLKNNGYTIVMNPGAVCYHKSQTYSHIPDFRRPLNAYFMGRNRQLYQRKHLNALSYWVYCLFFLPVFVGFYTGSLVWRKKFSLIPHFLKGVFDGLRGCRKNPYQKRPL